MLREAVRLIEHHQVARMRRGPGGGLIVTTPDAAPATRAMVIYLEYVGTTVDELFAARLLLEPLACGLAAERVDEPEIAALRAALAATADQPERGDLHLALAEAAGNPVLALFVEILTRLTARYARGTGPPTADARRGLRADHAAIVDAVTAGDVTRARTLTEQHVRAVTEWLRDQPRTAAGGSPNPRRSGASVRSWWPPRSTRTSPPTAGAPERCSAARATCCSATECPDRYCAKRFGCWSTTPWPGCGADPAAD